MIFLELFFTFFKIGLFTFGGGYAMIPLIQSEMSIHGWISVSDLINFIAISQSTPGPFSLNISTYIGNTTAGFFGAAVSTLALSLPSFIIILVIAKFYDEFKKSHIVGGAMSGLRPAAVGLIGGVLVSVSQNVVQSLSPNYTAIIAIILFVFLIFLQIKNIHPIFIILISATVGILTGIIFQIPA